MFDPLETLTYIAANTNRIVLGTSVIDMLFHNPVVLARTMFYLKEELFVDLGSDGLKMNTKLPIYHLMVEARGQMNLSKY